MEKLSVIIPTYNAERYLREAVSSVRAQDWPGGLEIIIVDDGSTDDTYDLAFRLGDVVLSERHGGAARARNSGLRAASGEWVLFLDADDVLTSDAVKNLYKPVLRNQEWMAVFGKAVDFISPELTREQRMALCAREQSYFGRLTGCAIIRRRAFERIGMFDESLVSGETVDWQLKFRDAKLPAAQVDFVTLQRRLHMTNTGRVDRMGEMRNYAAILRRRNKAKGNERKGDKG